MKISELKLNQEVEINGHTYKHKGIQKIRKQNFGLVQQRVFESETKDILPKHFQQGTERNKRKIDFLMKTIITRIRLMFSKCRILKKNW